MKDKSLDKKIEGWIDWAYRLHMLPVFVVTAAILVILSCVVLGIFAMIDGYMYWWKFFPEVEEEEEGIKND